MLETINPQFAYGVAGTVGGIITLAVGYRKARQAKKKIKFDIHRAADTIVEAVGVALAFSVGIPVSNFTLVLTIIAASGIDSLTNKFGIKLIPLLKNLAKKKK